MFGAIFNRALKEVKLKLSALGCTEVMTCDRQRAPWAGSVGEASEAKAPHTSELLDVAYVDDDAYFVRVPSPKKLCGKSRRPSR